MFKKVATLASFINAGMAQVAIFYLSVAVPIFRKDGSEAETHWVGVSVSFLSSNLLPAMLEECGQEDCPKGPDHNTVVPNLEAKVLWTSKSMDANLTIFEALKAIGYAVNPFILKEKGLKEARDHGFDVADSLTRKEHDLIMIQMDEDLKGDGSEIIDPETNQKQYPNGRPSSEEYIKEHFPAPVSTVNARTHPENQRVG